MTQEMLLTLNVGSSSVKFQLFSINDALICRAQGAINALGNHPSCVFQINQDPKPTLEQYMLSRCTHEQAIEKIMEWIDAHPELGTVTAVAHRVVHGGTLFTQSVLINSEVIAQLRQFNALAPLHQPHNIAAIEWMALHTPELIQIACFDTAFHAHHSPLFTTYALPQEIRDKGVRRYGFHGLSYEWVAHILNTQYPELAQGRIVSAHLGNGSSVCAMKHGMSIDTSMGLTALDGIPMGTRCGSLDPGALIYMARDLGLSLEAVEEIIYNQSGLLGLSGITNDVQKLLASEAPQAAFALDYFCLKTAQFIAMMSVSLGGMDALVFTGGIGENSQIIRESVCHHLQSLPPFSVLVIPANEEHMMALHALALLKNA